MTDSMRPITIEIPVSVAHKLSETFEGTPEDAALAGLKLINGMGQTSYNNLLELAKQLDSSPAKTLRTAIDLLIKDSARLKLTHGTVGRPKINEARDAKIYARIKAGATHVQVADEFSLSLVRIGQITARQRVANGDYTPKRLLRTSDTSITTVTTLAPQLHNLFAAKPEPEPTLEPEPTPEPTVEPPVEVLSLKVSDAPRKLAVIPPSMKNPELFPAAKEIKPVDLNNLDNRIFDEDFDL